MKKMLLFASVAAMLAACSEDDQPLVDTPVAEQGRTVTVTATLPTATRLALTEENNTIKVDWKASGETFAVVPTEAAAPAIFTQTSGNQFTGTLTGSGPYYAFYPANQLDVEESCSATSVGYSLMAQWGPLDDDFTLMYAQSEDGKTFSFRHLTAIVKFTLSGLEAGSEVSDVHIASTTNLPFSGTVDLTTGTLTADSEENVLFMGLADCTVATDGTCSFYACLPPISKDNVLTMTLTTSAGDNYVTTVEFAKDIEAGKYYRATRTVTKQEATSQLTTTTVASESLSGEGTEDAPYLIQSAADLLYLSQLTNLFSTSSGLYYRLTTNIKVASDVTWTPINEFRGTFDGNGKTISGTLATSGSTQGGVFRSLYGTVKNLNVSATITGNYSEGSLYIGGIVGYLQSAGTVESCTFSGTITKMDGNAGQDIYVGGIAGRSNGTIKNCTNTGTVNGPDAKYYESYSHVRAYVGGIAGSASGNVYGCTHSGSVVKGNDCDDDTANSYLYTGSIAGSAASGTVVCSCNTATTNTDMATVGSGSVSETCSHTTAE